MNGAIFSSLICDLMTVYHALFVGRRVTEKGRVISVEGCVVAKSAGIAYRDGLLALGDPLLRDEQSLVHNVFFRCLVELALE